MRGHRKVGVAGIRHHGGRGRKLGEFFKRQTHKRGHKQGAGGAKHH